MILFMAISKTIFSGLGIDFFVNFKGEETILLMEEVEMVNFL